MPPPFPEAKITLDYPLYGCDFDPNDPNRLFVGGGGGASRTGVGNKITSLDASSRDHERLEVTGQVDLSASEDNVTTLCAGAQRGPSKGNKAAATLLYAGVSSGAEDLAKGKNEHFRVFSADLPKPSNKILGARISELSRSQLFTTQDQDAYQRLLRLTQPFPGAAQLGAVATGLAREPQISLFDVSAAGNNLAPRVRGVLDLKKEAVDLDVIQVAEDKYQLLYCDDFNIYALDVPRAAGSNIADEPRCIYTMPSDDVRPSLRCIRYLTPYFAFAVANLPRPGGVVLYGFRLPRPGRPDSTARIAINTRLPKRQGAKATGLAVANLSPPASAGARQGDAQFVAAVASNDFSIHLYTLDHQVAGDVDLLANLWPLRVLDAVHPAMVTNLAFSRFSPPKSGTGKTQYLKLASTSVSNTLKVQSIALKKHFDKVPSAKARRGGPPRLPRYVTALEAKGPSATNFLFALAGVMLLISVLVQGLLEVKGLSRPVVAGHSWLPARIHAVPASYYSPASSSSPLARLLSGREKSDGPVVLLDSDDGTISLGTGAYHGGARSWDELSEQQRALWAQRLRDGGHWAEDMGTTIFKGILFGELAGVVGGMVGG